LAERDRGEGERDGRGKRQKEKGIEIPRNIERIN